MTDGEKLLNDLLGEQVRNELSQLQKEINAEWEPNYSLIAKLYADCLKERYHIPFRYSWERHEDGGAVFHFTPNTDTITYVFQYTGPIKLNTKNL